MEEQDSVGQKQAVVVNSVVLLKKSWFRKFAFLFIKRGNRKVWN
jgi:hypothetical protein